MSRGLGDVYKRQVTMVAIVATVATDASIRLVADVSTNIFFLTVVSGSSRLTTMSVMMVTIMVVTMLDTYRSYVVLVVLFLVATCRSSVGHRLVNS